MSDLAARITGVLRETRVPPLIWAIGGGIAILGVLGAVHSLVVEIPAFDLQGELARGFAVPVLFSATLLFIAAGIAARHTRKLQTAGMRAGVWLGLAALFAFMAADDLLHLHEDLGLMTNVEWQVLYLPVFALAGVLWLVVLRSSAAPANYLWVAGATAWVVSQLLEYFVWGRVPNDSAATPLAAGELEGAEELLELAGTMLLIWAMLLISARAPGPTAEPVRRYGTASPTAPASSRPPTR